MDTKALARGPDPLDEVEGIWCVPGSPYASLEGALTAISWARRKGLPFLGTCGGYQHAALEFARNALGYAEAGSTEIDAATSLPVVVAMSCPLIDRKDSVRFDEGAELRRIYGGDRAQEKFQCSYGLDLAYAALVAGSALQIVGWSEAGDPRALELKEHPFFFGTAYQPERVALEDRDHPLLVAFAQAVRTHAASKWR